jgi:alpha-1,3-rhamnosyl/mannosyltransferase
MSVDDLSDTTQPGRRPEACVAIAVHVANERTGLCLESVREHTPPEVPIVTVGASAEAVSGALERFAPADVILLSEPCLVTTGWLTRLREAAHADTNTASASALTIKGTPLALTGTAESPRELEHTQRSVAEHTLRLRPRLNVIVGPCVYLRREAIDLIGSLDTGLELRWALEVDFAQRCLLTGLAHVAADDVVVEPLASTDPASGQPPDALRERYPYLYEPHAEPADGDAVPYPRASLAASSALARGIEAARRPPSRLGATIDGRALGSIITGTQRHIVELIEALAATDTLDLRVLVGPDTSAEVIEQLRSLPATEILPVGEIDRDTPRSTIFHRPQQVFETGDMRLALRLGARLVLNQLDLIAYRNPAYHADAGAWRRYRRFGRQALAAADRVIVFSDHTRRELISDELTSEERVRLVPPGLDHRSRVEARPPALGPAPPGIAPRDALIDRGRFMLCLGTDFRHKNRLFALRLLAQLRERYGWKGALVFAGTHVAHGSSRELEDELLEEYPPLREAVIELGPIDEHEKTWLMERAAAVVYPSVYEGFGLVPLEAALSGVPCLFAPQSSLTDVLPSELAAIVPWDARASAAQAYALLADPSVRAQHVDRLAEVARGLRWEASAASTVEVYREASVAPTRDAAALSTDEVRREHELRELIAAHDALVARLVGERKHAQRMYDELNAEVGSGLSLIGPNGTLPEDAQRALLALSDRPKLSRPLYGLLARIFRAARAASGRLHRSA